MGRQVLYEWRGSCDRSTSQSRYFSLTVNTHTRDQPIKTIRLAKPRNGRDVHRNGSSCGVCVTPSSVRDAPLFKRVFFYEWRLWYVNESDWEKKRHVEVFSMSTSPRSIPSRSWLKRIGANANTVGVLIDDYVRKSWRTTPRLKTQSFRIMFTANTHFRPSDRMKLEKSRPQLNGFARVYFFLKREPAISP